MILNVIVSLCFIHQSHSAVMPFLHVHVCRVRTSIYFNAPIVISWIITNYYYQTGKILFVCRSTEKTSCTYSPNIYEPFKSVIETLSESFPFCESWLTYSRKHKKESYPEGYLYVAVLCGKFLTSSIIIAVLK